MAQALPLGAMMGKLPLGVVSPNVKMSSGGRSDPLNFYATSYCTAYGQEGFKPRVGSHVSTGYRSNLRPLVTYQPGPDAMDSLALRGQFRGNSQTATSKSHCPLEVPSGRHSLPWHVSQASSCPGWERPDTGPPSKEARRVHFDTPECRPPAALPLHQPHGRDLAEWETARYGPCSVMSKYDPRHFKEPCPPQDLPWSPTGARGETSFIEDRGRSPVTLQTPSWALSGDPVLFPGRGATLSDAPTRPAAQVPPPSSESSSVGQRSFQLPQPLQQTNAPLLDQGTTGSKEPAGLSWHRTGYGQSPCDHPCLTTCHLGSEDIRKGLDREGWAPGGAQPQKTGDCVLKKGSTHAEPEPGPKDSWRCPYPALGRTLTENDSYYRHLPCGSRYMASS